MYDSTMDRFTSEDPLPVRPGDPNPYVGMRNNPQMYTDRSGREPQRRDPIIPPGEVDDRPLSRRRPSRAESQARADQVKKEMAEYRAVASAAALQHQESRYLEALNQSRPGVSDVDDIKLDAPINSYGIDAAKLVMLKQHPESALWLRKLEVTGVKVVLDRESAGLFDRSDLASKSTGDTLQVFGKRWGRTLTSPVAVAKNSLIAGLVGFATAEWSLTAPARGAYKAAVAGGTGERDASVAEAADALYAKLKHTFDDKTWFEDRLGRVGKLFIRDIGNDLQDEGLRDVYEEWEASLAVSGTYSGEFARATAKDLAVQGVTLATVPLAAMKQAAKLRTIKAFKSFDALKRELGPAGEGKAWHHIVEQSQESRFGAEAIHNMKNVVVVTTEVNTQLNALYSSIRPAITGSTTLRVRDWLKTKTYEEARTFGLKAIKNVEKGIWP